MENVSLNKRRQSQMLGILFAEYQILTTEQASLIRQQMDKPSNFYANTDSLWAFYCYVTIALQSSHPKTWMEDQRILHYFISTVGNFTPVAAVVPEVEEEVIVDPLANNYGQPENQTNLLVQIAEMEVANTQVVQEEIEIEPVVHQSEEIILEANEAEEDHVIIEDEIWTTEEEPLKIATIVNTNEAEETPFDLDAEDDAMLDALLVPIEREISPENSTDIFPQDETVIYTDPVGNTFEAPVVIDNFQTLVPTPEEHAQFEAEEALFVAPWDEQPEANLDLKESVAEVKEDNSSDFDFDFGSDDPEETVVDNTPDFF
jgi:hypothetical protein